MSRYGNLYAVALFAVKPYTAPRADGADCDCYLSATFARADSEQEAEAGQLKLLMESLPASEGWGQHRVKAQFAFDLEEFYDRAARGEPFGGDDSEGDDQESGGTDGTSFVM